jgi:hypothetical protein
MTDLRKAAEQAAKELKELIHWHGIRYSNDKLVPAHRQPPEIKSAMKTLKDLRQALTQPEQEPVAYEVDADVINSHGQSEYRTFLAYRPDPAMTTGGMYEVTKVLEARPLYTAAQWVGLTDDERFSKDWQETVARVEAKLKEKNGG